MRQSWRKIKIVKNTKAIASIKVLNASSREAETNSVLSKPTVAFNPGGKLGCNSAILALIKLAVFQALLPGN